MRGSSGQGAHPQHPPEPPSQRRAATLHPLRGERQTPSAAIGEGLFPSRRPPPAPLGAALPTPAPPPLLPLPVGEGWGEGLPVEAPTPGNSRCRTRYAKAPALHPRLEERQVWASSGQRAHSKPMPGPSYSPTAQQPRSETRFRVGYGTGAPCYSLATCHRYSNRVPWTP